MVKVQQQQERGDGDASGKEADTSIRKASREG